MSYKARVFEELKEYEGAAKTFEEMSRLEPNDEEKFGMLVNAAIDYARAGDREHAVRLLEIVKSKQLSPSFLRSWLIPGLRAVAEADKDDMFELALLEQSVELNISDAGARFGEAAGAILLSLKNRRPFTVRVGF
jgi:tetratricopeptide (TPR) repeat protein